MIGSTSSCSCSASGVLQLSNNNNAISISIQPVRRRRAESLQRWHRQVPVAFACIFWICSGLADVRFSSAFQVQMLSDSYSYQPPVKTSVKQLQQNGRFSASGIHISSSGSGSGGMSSRPGSSSSDGSNSSVQHRASNHQRSTAKSAFAGTLSMPTSSSSSSDVTVESFEQRMRDLVLGTPTSASLRGNNNGKVANAAGPPVSTRQLPPNVQIIETLQDYKRVVGDERNRIVAVRFYASYCKACQAVAPHFYHMAKQFPDTVFVDVPVTERNAALHQGLGIATLPFAHIYHPTGLVEEQKLTRNHIAAFKVKLESYVTGSCPLPTDDDDAADV